MPRATRARATRAPSQRPFRTTARPDEVLAIVPAKAFYFMFSCANTETTLTDDGVAIVNIEGGLEHKAGWFDSYESIVQRVREAAEDEDVKSVVLKIDSPGGDVSGLYESVKTIQAIKDETGKPFYAYANELAASAAYALACSCDEIYMPEAAGVGSIGVISMMGEMTGKDRKDGIKYEVITSGARKADGNPHVEISDGARKRVQRRVDGLAAMFFALVADSRGVSAKKVEALQADVFYGDDALQTRLADGLASWDEFLGMVSDAASGLDNLGGSGSRSPSQPTDRPVEKDKSMGLLALKKAKAAAYDALKKAKTEAANTRAGKEYREACQALASAEALIEAKKMKKTKYVEETEDDGEEDGDDDSEDDDDAEDAEDDDSAEDGSAESDAEDDDAEDDAESGKASGGLLKVLGKITGKRTAAGIIGTVRAAVQGNKRVGKLEKDFRALKVEGLIRAGRKDGKIEKGLVEFCTKMGMRSTDELEAYLAAKSPAVRTSEDPPVLPKDFAAGAVDGLTAEMAEIARTMGLTPEEAAAGAKKINATNGAPKR